MRQLTVNEIDDVCGGNGLAEIAKQVLVGILGAYIKDGLDWLSQQTVNGRSLTEQEKIDIMRAVNDGRGGYTDGPYNEYATNYFDGYGESGWWEDRQNGMGRNDKKDLLAIGP